MKIVDAITGAVDSNLLIVMAVSFVAVVWWGFRGRSGGDGGGNDAGGDFWGGSDGDGDGGDGGE